MDVEKLEMRVEAVDTDKLATATRVRLVIEGPIDSISDLTSLILLATGSEVVRAIGTGPDGETDLTEEFNNRISPLSTGDTSGN
jgi:hypothetical protein